MRNETKISNKKVLTGGIIAVSILIIFIAFGDNPVSHSLRGLSKVTKPIPHRNHVDKGLSLYPKKNITQNAISINSDFKNMAFDVETPKKSPLSNQLASVIKSIQYLVTPSKEIQTTKEFGSWVWTPTLQMTPEYIESILSAAKTDGINTMYISIDSYLDIFMMEKSEEREKLKKEFGEILNHFIAEANAKGIEVDAEAGWQNWAEEGNTYKAFIIVNYVKNFNSTYTNKFRGFQYDVEPYLLTHYEENKAAVLKNFLKLVDETEVFLSSSDLRFSVVIPDFYDKEDKATPKFEYNGNKDFAFGHLLSILDRRPQSSIIIMSYRNFAKGEDGTIEISNNEMQTARKRASNTKIIIAQETSKFPPEYITFHHTSKKYLSREINKINEAFLPHPNFGGMAMHYVNALIELE